MVPKQEIVDNGYDLSMNRYKKIEYVPVEYPPTSEILANIRNLENEITKDLDELEKMLKDEIWCLWGEPWKLKIFVHSHQNQK